MPQNERSLKRHECSCVLRNDARRVVGSRATRRNRSAIHERICGSRQAFARTHGMRDLVLVFRRLCVEFDADGIGVDIIQKNLNMKLIMLALLLDGR